MLLAVKGRVVGLGARGGGEGDQPNSAAGEKKKKRTPLVSVMSGQSGSVSGPGTEQAASGGKMSSRPGLCR